MTKQAKSDEEIRAMAKSYRGDGATADELAAHEVGFRQAEELHLPIINQQAEEIEKLKADIGRFRIAMKLADSNVKSYEERYRQTQSRFDELVKSLEGCYVLNVKEPFRLHANDDGLYVSKRELQSIISKAKEV